MIFNEAMRPDRIVDVGHYSLVPDPAHAPTLLVYTGSKPRILHGMGE